MSSEQATADSGIPREEMMSALFAHLVMQQSNMAMMLMGKVMHPETGQTTRDMEAAKLFIDVLEMLEAKTKGNLTREEARLLQQSLMSLRMTFVESVEGAPQSKQSGEPAPGPQSTQPPPQVASSPADSAAKEEEEHRKKFSKKY
jgi:hypothetical protein